MELFKKLTNLIMPIDEEEFEEEENVERGIKHEVPKMAVNGIPSSYAVPSYEPEKPKFSVYSGDSSDLSIKIYVPHEFGDVRRIADDLKAKRAVIINFEEVESAEQRRICDFANGVCYVMDGQARRVSDYMVMYVPAGVSVAAVSAKSFGR